MVQLAHPGVSPDVSPELIAKIPPIVDVDAHLVEPPDIWTPRLPEKFREAGPHVEYHPAGSIVLQGAGYIEAPGTEGPDVVWWNYEGTMTSLKRHIAASGFKPEEITLTATTYDEIRPGCYQVPDRLADMDVNGVEAQLCFPELPALRGPDLPVGQGQRARRAVHLRVQRLDGRRVVRLERRSPPPAVHRAAVGRRARGRRDPSQRGTGCARGRVHRDPGVPRAPEHPHRLLGPVLRTRARRRRPSSVSTSVRAPRRCRRRRTRPMPCPRR